MGRGAHRGIATNGALMTCNHIMFQVRVRGPHSQEDERSSRCRVRQGMHVQGGSSMGYTGTSNNHMHGDVMGSIAVKDGESRSTCFPVTCHS